MTHFPVEIGAARYAEQHQTATQSRSAEMEGNESIAFFFLNHLKTPHPGPPLPTLPPPQLHYLSLDKVLEKWNLLHIYGKTVFK